MGFSDDIKGYSDREKQRLDYVQKSVLFQLGQSVVVLSPVDTGIFRSNWRFEIGGYDNTYVNDESIIESKSATVGRLQAKINNVEVGSAFFISNNLPYAIPLENGHSQQRPEGMVRQTVLKFDKFMKDSIAAAKQLY